VALLEVENLSVWFHTRNGVTKAVNDVSFSVDAGETLAIVGESGSGKSVCCYRLLGLVPMPPGRVEQGRARFAGRDLLQLPPHALRALRGNQIATIFQDPMTCLNPYLTLGEQLMEPLLYHRNATRKEARAQALALLDEVGIVAAARRFDAYPHEFSGGIRQRVMIAMALIAEPKLLIADEPTTALDVTIQAQILRLIAELQARRKLAVILVSHDLAVVADIADDILVMKDGAVVESGAPQTLFAHPQHPYTQKLLAASRRSPKSTPAAKPQRETLIEVSALCTWFRSSDQRLVKAVDDVSLKLYRNEILGVVGESGSGKSTLGRSMLQLVRPTSGSVRLRDQELTTLGTRALRPLRRQMQMIFQDPYASLNPRMSVFDALAEPLLYHGLATRKTVTAQVLALMDDVGLAHHSIRKYPHEFSGGQRQRIAIGRAIATKPQVVIADEPVSALDVTIQAQILDLILELVARHNLSLVFISHDLSIVRYLCDRVLVLHHGKLIESGITEQLWQHPREAYTRELLAAVPRLEVG
jgi:oligopeptide transport system ATP-binding protein